VAKVGTSKKKWGKVMATYPLELAQDAAYHSYTSRQTELWSLPKPAQGLNTYSSSRRNMYFMFKPFLLKVLQISIYVWD